MASLTYKMFTTRQPRYLRTLLNTYQCATPYAHKMTTS